MEKVSKKRDTSHGKIICFSPTRKLLVKDIFNLYIDAHKTPPLNVQMFYEAKLLQKGIFVKKRARVQTPSSFNVSFCFLFNPLGVLTITSTKWSPVPRPLVYGMPLSLSLNTVPDCVPSGIFNSTLP